MKARILSVKFILISILFASYTEVSAQMVIEMPQVDLMLNTNIMYQQVAKNTYRRVDIQFDYTKNDIVFEIGVSDRTETLQELNKNSEILYIKDIKTYSTSDFKTYLSKNNWFNRMPDTNKAYLLQQYSSDIMSLAKLDFTKRRFGGFGAFIEKDDDTITKWRMRNAKFSRTVVLNFGNDKHVALFLNANRRNRSVFKVNNFLIPLENKTQIRFDNHVYKTPVKISLNDTLYNFDKKERAIFFKPDKFYRLKKTANNKYKLIDEFNKEVLNKSFDTIQFNSYFIIAKENNTCSIYNTWLKKMDISNIKEAYFYRNGLEVLSTNGAQYFDANFDEISQFPVINYNVCGTVSHKRYSLEFNPKNKIPHTIKIDYDFASSKKSIGLLGLSTTDTVSFLNNALSYTHTGNDDFTNTKTVFPNLLKVKRGDKVGIVSYNTENVKRRKVPQKKSNVIRTPKILSLDYSGNVKIKEVLPFIYDKIELKNDGLVYFYKDSKVGIYPRHKTVKYDSIWQRTNVFYEISINGKKGWLSINTNKEYFFKN